MAEINYEQSILELVDGTPVDFIGEDEDDTRFKYRCVIHVDNAADPVWSFDHQGKARDGAYPDVRAAETYSIWQVWTKGTLEPGLTTREPVDRALKDHEYMIRTDVDLVHDTVTTTVTMG